KLSLAMSSELAASLGQLSREQGVTLFMLLLAVFKALLYRYCRQEDVVVGTPVANRSRAHLEELIGLFTNTLVLRTRMSGSSSFRELLNKVRGTCMDAYAHQDMPFGKLVEELNPQRDLSRQPLFQVVFHLNNTPLEFRFQAGESKSLPLGHTLL